MTRKQGARHWIYAALALPLAFAGLPLYVHLPQYYAVVHGVSLQALGLTLLLVRLVDMAQDPFLGWLADRTPRRKRWIGLSIPFLGLTFFLLFHYPGGDISAPWWLGITLVLTYTFFSIIQINYYALGTDIAQSGPMHTRVAAWREGVMLAGILLAAVLPDALARFSGKEDSFPTFSWMFLFLILACGFLTLSGHYPPHKKIKSEGKLWSSLASLLSIRKVRLLLLFFFCNTLSIAATSTLYLFFIEDVVGGGEHAGALLGTYFLLGALGMPVWAALADKVGREKAMAAALMLAVVCFIDCFQLERGDITRFYVIAVLTGLSLGADMALPVAMMSDLLKSEKQSISFGFGLWNFISKGNMALAAGITLPLLGMMGYQPGTENTEEALLALKSGYAVFPCLMKVAACGILWYGFIKKGRHL